MASSSVTVIHTEGWKDEIVYSHRSCCTDQDLEGSNKRMDYAKFQLQIDIAAEKVGEEEARSTETFVRTVHAARTGSNVSEARQPSMNDIARSRSTMSFAGAITVEEKSTLIGDDSFRVDDPVMAQDRVDAKSGNRTVLPASQGMVPSRRRKLVSDVEDVYKNAKRIK